MSSENRLTIKMAQLSFALHLKSARNNSHVAPSSAPENGKQGNSPPHLRHTRPSLQALGVERISKLCQRLGAKPHTAH